MAFLTSEDMAHLVEASNRRIDAENKLSQVVKNVIDEHKDGDVLIESFNKSQKALRESTTLFCEYRWSLYRLSNIRF